MIEFHPEYDCETRTWFVPDQEYEAPTLAALQLLLGPQAVIKDYYPLGMGLCAAVKFMENVTKAASSYSLSKLRPKILDVTGGYLHGPKPRSPRPPRPKVEGKYNTERILDMWAAGMTAAEIRADDTGGVSKTYLRVIVHRARAKGDPRAVRRNRGYDAKTTKGDHHV
jgi:hypothetical protein